MATGAPPPPRSNVLGRQRSPYLLQHAHNPVAWQPWGKEAFAAAAAEQKPIFLSSGYSSCHWCHVMERESFEDAEVAEVLNNNFIPVKLDKEEHPAVDAVYMAYVQATSGGGGWPMSVWLTPDGLPFLGGTYFPKDDRGGQRGFLSLLRLVAQLWATKRGDILDSAADVAGQLRESTAPRAAPADTGSAFQTALRGVTQQMLKRYDAQHGGFGAAPKFPRPCELDVLLIALECSDADQHAGVAGAVTHTLRSMCLGGVYDHVGGGLARYSVDPLWHVPHFEKMLYDQPQVVATLCAAAAAPGTGGGDARLFGQTVRGTLDFMHREMFLPCGPDSGAMCASLDADSVDPATGELREGFFYVWAHSDVVAALEQAGIDGDTAAAFLRAYDVRPGGNVVRSSRSDPHGEFKGLNCLYLASKHGGDKFGACRHALYLHREAHKPRPRRDGTAIAAWNGMCLTALCRASRLLTAPQLCDAEPAWPVTRPGLPGCRDYLDLAEQVATFAHTHLWDASHQRLARSASVGDNGHVLVGPAPACAADYAALAQGCCDLFCAGGNTRWLAFAAALLDALHTRFGDTTGGLFSAEASPDVALPLRLRDEYDGAEPSAGAHAAAAHVALARLLGGESGAKHAQQAALLAAAFSPTWSRQPLAMPAMLASLAPALADKLQLRPCVVIVAGDMATAACNELLDTAWRTGGMHPGRVVLPMDTSREDSLAFWAQHNPEALANAQAGLLGVGGAAVAVVCTSNACLPPTADAARLAAVLTGTHQAQQAGQSAAASAAAAAVAAQLRGARPIDK